MSSNEIKKLKTVMIIAGEASGDLHGANLVNAMKKRNAFLSFYGVGGKHLESAGVRLLAHSSDMAVVGITEVISKLPYILKVRRAIKESLINTPPDLVILIDYPDFNMPVAKIAKKMGCKVLYYISPQIWAWRKRRIYRLEKYVDKIAAILPFEPLFYKEVDLEVQYVGHPLLDILHTRLTKEETLEKFNLLDKVTTIALLPGSRMSEINKLLPEMLKAAEIVSSRLPAVQFLLPLADTLEYKAIVPILKRSPLDIRIIEHNAYEAISISTIAMVASGTATLETGLLGIPMIIVYKVSPLSYLLGKIFIKVKNIGIINIIAGKTIVPELIQREANGYKMADCIYNLLTNTAQLMTIKNALSLIREKLGDPGASERTADIACDLLHCARE